MNEQIGINVPESYGDSEKDKGSVPAETTIKEVPNSTNKVRKKVIRGVLKGDGFS